MRVSAGICLKDGFVTQSHDWLLYRPVADVCSTLRTLSEYCVDEIIITNLNRDFATTIENYKLLDTPCNTPVCFGGGVDDKLLDYTSEYNFVERFHFSTNFLTGDLEIIKRVMNLYGRQSIVAVLPVKEVRDTIQAFCTRSRNWLDLQTVDWASIEELSADVVIYDVQKDGTTKGFNWGLLESIPVNNKYLSICGGINISDIRRAKKANISAVVVDNSILHQDFGLPFL
ncbi:HisA/HisF-related TIM barrel protein [Planktomarina temperata]|nr:HisA/HisF-related TIM barrel protein [Planktomarina temperata]